MTRLDRLSEEDVALLGLEYEEHGEVTLTEVQLPPGFRPPVADLVLVRIGDQVEAFVSASVSYEGIDPFWRGVPPTHRPTSLKRRVERD